MKKIILLLVVFISLSTFAQSKFPSKKVAEKFLERTLIVELDDNNSKAFNDLLKDAYTNWEMTPVKFMNRVEVDELVSSKSEDYAILSCGNKINKKYLETLDLLSLKFFL